jgi:hypothetical protein
MIVRNVRNLMKSNKGLPLDFEVEIPTELTSENAVLWAPYSDSPHNINIQKQSC